MGSIPGAVGNFNFPINGAQATSLTPFGFVSGVVNGNGPSRLEIGPNGISSALVGNNFTPDPNSSIVNMAVPGAAPFTFNASGGLNSQANGLMPTITGQNPIFSGQLTSFGGSGNNPFGITPPTQALSGGNLFNTGFLSPGAGPAFTGNASSGFTSLLSNLQNTLQQMTQALSQISGSLGFRQMAPQMQGFAGNAGSTFPSGMIPFSPQMQGFAGNAGSSFPGGMIPFSPQMQGFAGNAGSSFPGGMIPFSPQMQGFAGNAGSSFPGGMIPFSPQMQGFAGNAGSSFPGGIAANGGNLLSNPLLNG
ncbi:MAG: hypothetical protein K2X66_12360, partial [Cyanobacteria bacterium]|nr:hypothetical protein [Cyanobacteriota bacterium]